MPALSNFTFACLIAIATGIAGGASAKQIVGHVTDVRDGDTIEVSENLIRLWAVNCEEIESPGGLRAKLAITELVRGRTLNCTLTGEWSHDRQIGRCVLRDGFDLGAAMIGFGLCGRCAAWDPDGVYVSAEKMGGKWDGYVPGYCR